MSKLIVKYEDAKARILSALDKIADPVVQTLTPKGSNTMYEDVRGGIYNTNDGVTIAKEIESDDELEDMIIGVVKHAAMQTNKEAGDGTTTTTGMSRIAVKGGIKMIDEGMNRMELKKHLEHFAKTLRANLKPIKIKGDEQLLNIAKISANNDEKIAKDVVKVINVVGENGLVFINPNNKPETEIEEDKGFVMENGMLSPDFAQEQGFRTVMEDVPVFITDKRLYYEEEAHTILLAAIEAGHEKLVIVARDFLNKALNKLVANHTKGNIQLILIKDSKATEQDSTSLVDLATYLGGRCIREKDGKLVDNITMEDFIMVKKVYATQYKSVFITNNPDNKELKKRVAEIKKELKDEDNKDLERRLAVLTKGMVTIKVGGATPIETQEKIFRYEDAINATRSALRDGYLAGGGLALLGAYDDDEYPVGLRPMFRRYAEFTLRQIAENCGEHFESLLKKVDPKKNIGYNAATGEICNVLEAGIIDPYKVTDLAIQNSISVATAILTSRYFIVNKKKKDEPKD